MCQNPPVNVQDLNSVLRSCALEADRVALKAENNDGGNQDGVVFKTMSQVRNMVRKEARQYYVDRESRYDGRRRENDHRRSPGPRGYGRSRSPSPRVPRDVCIICSKRGCHSPKHRSQARTFLTNLHRCYTSTSDVDDKDVYSDNDEDDGQSSDSGTNSVVSMIHACRSFAAMGLYPSNPDLRIDAIMLDTGCNYYSTIGDRLVDAACIASVRRTQPIYTKARTIVGLGGAKLTTKGTLQFHFVFGGNMYTIKLHIVAGDDPMLMSHADMDRNGFNYQSWYKVLERVKDAYYEPVEMRSGLPFYVFQAVGFFSASQLRAMHRNLGHPSIEKQMKVIESAEIKDLPPDIREKVDGDFEILSRMPT